MYFWGINSEDIQITTTATMDGPKHAVKLDPAGRKGIAAFIEQCIKDATYAHLFRMFKANYPNGSRAAQCLTEIYNLELWDSDRHPDFHHYCEVTFDLNHNETTYLLSQGQREIQHGFHKEIEGVVEPFYRSALLLTEEIKVS